jgi:isoquinoline 1-oxidoreductase subunit beta
MMHTLQSPDRRAALALAGKGAGLVLAVWFGVSDAQAQDGGPKKYAGEAMPGGVRDDPMLFVAIGADGTVTITCHRSEMGQGIRTSMAMVIADELEADWSRVRVAQADGGEARWGNQNTDGSRSMRHGFMAMRRAGCAARRMLEAAAAARWRVPAGEVRSEQHVVVHARSGRRLGYGALAAAAARQPVPAAGSLQLKKPEQFRWIGKGNTRLIDGPAIARGSARYGIDVRLPQMLHAVAARPPVFGGKLKSFDASEALKVQGVLRVIELPGAAAPTGFGMLGGVAVVARDTWSAMQGRAALKIEWDDGPNAGYDTTAFSQAVEAAATQPALVVRNQGDAPAVLAASRRRVEATYHIPHQAHASMEPPNAVARVARGTCEVWAPVQAPQAAIEGLSALLGLAPDKVTVHVTLLGGGFGRKSKPDFVFEAAYLSRAMDGTPVQMTWTREDDLRHDYFHSLSVERLEAALDESGRVQAWRHRSASPTILSIFAPDPGTKAPFELGFGLVNVPWNVPNLRIENPPAKAHTRIGWYRSVANLQHAFGIQCFVAELAHAARRDHRDYLLQLIGPDRRLSAADLSDPFNYDEDPSLYALETARLRRVIEQATAAAGWGQAMPAGQALGLAAHYSFVTYVAVVVQVQVGEGGAIAIPRVDIAVDCGAAVNPERVRAQMEGAVVMGLSLALHGKVEFKGGQPQVSNFNDCPVLRMNEAPREIRVHIVDGSFDRPLGGVGEPGMPPVAPALLNAVFSATGKRIRALPLDGKLS